MRAETVNPFVEAMVEVFREELGITCQKKGVCLHYVPVTEREVNLLIDIRGAAEAAVIYSMEEDTACALAGAFYKDKAFESYCYEVEDSVKELFNIVSGQALKILENKGLVCTRVGPPSVFVGSLRAVPRVRWPLLAVIFGTPVGLVRVSASMVLR